MLIGLGESGQLDAGRVANNKLAYRKARVTWLKTYSPLVDKIKNDVAELTGYPVENQEDFHFVKYNVDGEYKVHTDGKDRPKTALVYLNGSTDYVELFGFVSVGQVLQAAIETTYFQASLVRAG